MAGRGAWELAGGAKETGLSALFKGASVLNQKGEPVSVITHLKDKVVLLYFASTKSNWNDMINDFQDFATEGTGEPPVIIFVSNDKTKEDQMKLFKEMHSSWLCVEYCYDLMDLAKNFDIKMIPALVVLDRDGKAVVSEGAEQLKKEVFAKKSLEEVKKAAAQKWTEWRKLAGDWRVSSGYTLSGNAESSSASASPGAAAAAGPAQNDREAMRAARLAALEKRMGGGGAAPTGTSSSSSAAAAAAPAAPPSSTASASPATTAGASFGGPRVATLADASKSAGQSAASTGTSYGYSGGTYTLAGGPVAPTPPPAAEAKEDEEFMSDVASDGDASRRDPDVDLIPENFEENLATLTAMGFDKDSAKNALEAAEGNVDVAVNMLVG